MKLKRHMSNTTGLAICFNSLQQLQPMLLCSSHSQSTLQTVHTILCSPDSSLCSHNSTRGSLPVHYPCKVHSALPAKLYPIPVYESCFPEQKTRAIFMNSYFSKDLLLMLGWGDKRKSCMGHSVLFSIFLFQIISILGNFSPLFLFTLETTREDFVEQEQLEKHFLIGKKLSCGSLIQPILGQFKLQRKKLGRKNVILSWNLSRILVFSFLLWRSRFKWIHVVKTLV